MRRILVVCTGNVCRSPMAEVMIRHHLAGVRVASAGLAAMEGCPIDPCAERALAARGLSGGSHLARQVDAGLLDAADLVLAMEKRQLAALLALRPSLRGRAFLLSHRQGGFDIEDPYRRPQPVFDSVCEKIDSCIRDWQ